MSAETDLARDIYALHEELKYMLTHPEVIKQLPPDHGAHVIMGALMVTLGWADGISTSQTPQDALKEMLEVFPEAYISGFRIAVADKQQSTH